MKPTGRPFTAMLAICALGAAPQPPAGHSRVAHRALPAFVARARSDRFASNAVRRARLAYLMPEHLSAAAKELATRSVAAGASTYTVLNLNAIVRGTSPGVTFAPLALNDDGRIVGTATQVSGDTLGYIVNYHGSNGFLASSFGFQDYGSDFPLAISNKGGTVAGFTDGYREQADGSFEYTLSDLWTLTGATSSTLAIQSDVDGAAEHTLDVANQNITVGGASYNGGTPFGVMNCPISDFSANAITDSGLIVGYSRQTRATVLTLGNCPTFVPNAPLASRVDAVAQNGDMILADYDFSDPDKHNFAAYDLWVKGILHAIPLPAGYDAATYAVDAIAVNTSDVVVGNILSQATGQPVAAFEYAGGKSVNLQSLFPAKSGWVPSAVTGINDNGEIIGEGYLNSVLTPFALRH